MKTHIKMSDEQTKIFLSIKQVLEAEREIKPSDLDAIALLSVNMYVLDEALKSLECDGVMIITHNGGGQVVKSNPASQLMQQCQQSIRALMTELLMTPKAKSMLREAEVEEEDDEDPIALRNRKRGAA
ncbi:P27 family phage terminase small subunit [Aeromonas veronii]|uniref:P27 family phage terminase small subunit n=1 Tax=Aeromonas veronii TaxID=654 RepID=UPI003D1C01FC